MIHCERNMGIEEIFLSQYGRIARVIQKVIGNSARAEELAVEVFLKLWRHPRAEGAPGEAWLYRTAVRMGLDEIRRQTRRARYESLFALGRDRARQSPTPEQIHAAAEDNARVRRVLAAMDRRQSELLILRSDGLSYEEVASALGLNPASVGKLLSRAQQAFRKEYVKRYGEE